MARVTRRVALTVTPILAAVALGACGDGTSTKEKNAYAQEVNAAQTDFQRRTASVAQQKVPEETAAKIRLVQRFEETIDRVVLRLRSIDVPSEVRAEHQQLIDAMTSFRADVRKLTETYRRGDPREVSEELLALKSAEAEATARATAAIEAINAKLAAT